MTGWIWSGLEMVRRANRPSLENLGGVWVCCSTFWAINALAAWSPFVRAMSWGRFAVTMACHAISTGHSAVLRAVISQLLAKTVGAEARALRSETASERAFLV